MLHKKLKITEQSKKVVKPKQSSIISPTFDALSNAPKLMLINNLAATYIINIIAIIAIMVENKNQKILSRIFRDYKLPCVTDESVGVVLFFRGTINGCTLGKNTMPYSTCVYGEFILYTSTHVFSMEIIIFS